MRAAGSAEGEHCAAIQQRFNLFEGNTETLAICEAHNLASINRGPLATGSLTGKFDQKLKLPETTCATAGIFRMANRRAGYKSWQHYGPF